MKLQRNANKYEQIHTTANFHMLVDGFILINSAFLVHAALRLYYMQFIF